MKKQISIKVAREKYGIVVKRYHDYKYYLLDNGDVVDSDGDIRYKKPESVRVWFVRGYGNSIKAGVTIGDEASGHTIAEIEKKKLSHGVEYVMDLDWLGEYLKRKMSEKGYTTGITKRQKYPRIIIND